MDIKRAVDGKGVFCYYQYPYGWPRHLLIPRGKVYGQKFRIFVIVSPLIYKFKKSDTLIAGHDVNDVRALGYPLDKKIKLANFFEKNMAYHDLTVTLKPII